MLCFIDKGHAIRQMFNERTPKKTILEEIVYFMHSQVDSSFELSNNFFLIEHWNFRLLVC